jgi:hypothetical protein
MSDDDAREVLFVGDRVTITEKAGPHGKRPMAGRTGEIVAMFPQSVYDGFNFVGWELCIKFGQEGFDLAYGAYDANEVTKCQNQ